MSALFSPPGTGWQRVSIRLRDLRRLLIVVVAGLVGALGALGLQLTVGRWWPAALLLVVAGAAAAWGWSWAARNQAAWGYAEQEEELWVASGVMWRRLVVIPYGRMQFVDVSAGPVQRSFRIAKVTLHTASSHTAAGIPGLPVTEAARLRNRLTELGEAHGAGL